MNKLYDTGRKKIWLSKDEIDKLQEQFKFQVYVQSQEDLEYVNTRNKFIPKACKAADKQVNEKQHPIAWNLIYLHEMDRLNTLSQNETA